MGPYVRYTTFRLLLLLGAAVVLYVLGARGVLLVVLAAVASMALSYVLLQRPRQRVVDSITQRTPRRRQPDEDELAEDMSTEDVDQDPVPRGPGDNTRP